MTDTLQILTVGQRQALRDAYQLARSRGVTTKGAWEDVYNLLYGYLTTTNAVGADAPRSDVAVDSKTWLWLKGARFVNPGKGLFGDLIREYTINQYRQRYGVPPTDAMMDSASNEIARRFIGQWAGIDPDDNTVHSGGTQPTITETGLYDAGQAASEVFGKTLAGTANSDGPNAAGWAGTILFPNLGAPDFYRRLVLDALAAPDAKGLYQTAGATLRGVDRGSYDAVAAAAALEEYARPWLPSALQAGGDIAEQLAAYIRQVFVGFVPSLSLEVDTNRAFRELYGIEGANPLTGIGSDTFGVFGTNTQVNIFKSAHYAVGSIEGDTIGYTADGNGAFATDTDFIARLLDAAGLGPGGDVINAGRGNDTVYGTTGSDILDGGEGSNTLIYAPAAWSGALDRLYFSFDGKGKFDNRTIVDKWSFGGLPPVLHEQDIAVQFSTLLIDYRQNQIDDPNGPSGRKEVRDQDDAPFIAVTSTGSSSKDDGVLKRSETVALSGDLHKTRGANVSIDLGDSTAVAYHQDVVDASAVTHGVNIDLTSGRIRATDQAALSTASKIYVTNANEAVGTGYDDVLKGASGKRQNDANGNPVAGEGFSVLYGGGGNDHLIAAGWESHLYGGAGADQFSVGANSFIEDGTTDQGDASYFLGIPLTGGVNQWWQESGYAYWAPFSILQTAFPVIGANFILLGAALVDAVTACFVRYRMGGDGALAIDFGWGLGGTGYVSNYKVDLDRGYGTAGISVFQVEFTNKRPSLERLGNFVNLSLYAGFGHGLPGYDPLVLDLDGDGYQLTTETNSKVWFDYDHNGFARHTGWVGASDGFLARDVNGNGRIDDVSELFGNASQGGFDMLAGFDTNADGAITAADAVYATLKVWQDKNQNGVTDAGELKSLAELGIVSIGLATTVPGSPTAIGRNQIAREGNFTLASGVTHKVADVVFDVSTTNTRYLGDGAVSATAATLPQLTGFGTIRDLRVAMTQDPALRDQVAAFVANTTSDLTVLKSGAEAIIYAWAGVQGVPATALGGNGFTMRKLAFLEKYAGAQLMPRDAQGAPRLDNVGELEAMWADQVTRLTLRLAVQGPMAAAFAEVAYRPDLDLLVANGPTALADILHRVVAGLPAGHAAAAAQWAGWAPLLGALTDSMVRSDANTVRVDFLFQQLLRAADGVAQPLTLAELAAGLGIANLRLGTGAADPLARGTATGTVVYHGGGGDDVLTGGGGQDVYVFGHQVGHVVINDVEANPAGDRIRFAFHNAADVTMSRDGNDLVLTVKATGETIRVTGQFAPVVPLGSDVLLSTNKGVEDIQFADGTIAEIPEIMAAVGRGTDGADHLVGSMHSDVLTGGRGDDLLEGGDNADLYVVNAGDGHDVIRDVQTTPLFRSADMLVFGDGLAPGDIAMSRLGANGDDLLLTVVGTDQSIRIEGQFSYSVLGYNDPLATNSRIELFSFRHDAGGWSSRDIQQLLIDQSRTDGDDTVMGFGDDDVLDGGRGNDVLIGYDGQDTYRWGRGDGNDIVDERALYIDVKVGLGGLSLTARADTVEFKNLNRQDLVFARPSAAADLVVTDRITGETLTVYGQFAGFQTGVLGAQWFNRIEWFAFADGTRLSWQDVALITTTGGAGNDRLWGDVLADRLAGGAGDDVLSGMGGGDTYVFNLGDGHDTIDDHDESFLDDGFVQVGNAQDVLVLGAGITASMISFGRNGPDVDLIIGTGGDRVTLLGQDSYIYTGVFGNLSSSRTEAIRFADGTVWTWHDLNVRMIAAATTAGNDYTLGTSTDDVFYASAGDDVLDGGDGNDTYAFGRGSGHDRIRDHVDNVLDGNDDRLDFGPGVSFADLRFARDNDDLIITIADTGDSVRIEGQFGWSAYFTWHDVETFGFADGTSITKDDIQRILLTGTAGNDYLRGFSSNDVYEGGAGDDTLVDTDGNDIYLFGRGDGHDVIREHVDYVLLGDFDTLRFKAGIAPSDIALSRNGNDLILTVAGTSDSVTIEGQFAMSAWFTWNDIEQFEFADGTIWTKNQVSTMLLTGTPGNDTMIGTGGNDYLDGGAGDDVLRGGDGSDTYVFGRGYGHDSIYESVDYVLLGDDDQVVFGPGVAASDLRYARDGDTLIVTIAGTDDVLTIHGEFAYATPYTWNDVERFLFADGTVLTKEDLTRIVLTGTAGNDHIIGFGSGDTLDGGAGDDVLEGRNGSDTYRFGLGDGHDVILEDLDDGRSSEYDTLSFKAGVAPGDVVVTRVGQDAIFTLPTGDSIRVQGHFNEGYNEFLSFNDIERVLFADGTEWDKIEIDRRSIRGTPGDDVLLGSRYAQTYDGGAGNDDISAGNNDDILIGGTGNDRLAGDGGNDRYLYYAGDGDDVIDDYSFGWDGEDRLVFGPGIAPADLRFANNPNDGAELLISFANRPGSLRVIHQWWGDAGIEFLEFADGTVWDQGQIAAAWVAQQGTAGDDTIFGSEGDDTIVAGAGADYVRANQGNDVITGGTGNDRLEGGGGDDTYVYNLGDGDDVIYDYNWNNDQADRIRFGAGITPAGLTFRHNGNGADLVVGFAGQPGSILIEKQWYGDAGIETFEFADGTVWDQAQIAARFTAAQQTAGDDEIFGTPFGGAIGGGAGNDVIHTGDADDVITGGTGNDRLESGYGNDVYVYNLGDGDDTIYDYSWNNDQADRIRFGAGITPGMLRFGNNGARDDVVVGFAGQPGSITITRQWWGDAGIEFFEFADGTVWDQAQIAARYVADQAAAGGLIFGTPFAGAIGGSAGDDRIVTGDGDDVITGGTGNDRLESGYGNDVYVYNLGDGDDVVSDYSWNNDQADRIRFGAGIAADDLLFSRNGGNADLTISFKSRDGSILIDRQYWGDAGIEFLDFADGTTLTQGQFEARVGPGTAGDDTIEGTAGADELWGLDGNDVLRGGGGNDRLGGQRGADRLIGGQGDDLLEGGAGDDLLFGDEDVPLVTVGDNLLVNGSFETSGTVVGGGGWGIANADLPGWSKANSQTFEQVYSGIGGINASDGGYWLDMDSAGGDGSNMDISQTVGGLAAGQLLLLRFDHIGRTGDASSDFAVYWNGTLVASPTERGSTLRTTSIQLTAVAGSNVLRFVGLGYADNSGAALDNVRLHRAEVPASGGADTLIGGTGNDLLTGGFGDDSYRFARGDGQDTIVERNGQGSDRVVFAPGIAPGDVIVTGPGTSDILLSLRDSTDRLLLQGDGNANPVETIVFADGTSWSVAQLMAQFHPSNAAPLAAAGSTGSGAFTERSATTGSSTNDTAAGVIRFTDADAGDTHSGTITAVSATGVVGGLPANATLLGWLGLGAVTEPAGTTAGSLPWTFAAPDKAFDYLRAGQTATLTYTLRIGDGNGGTLDQAVTVTITGSNDLPIVHASSVASGAIAERAATLGSTALDTAAGTLAFTDADSGDGHSAAIASVAATGATGGLPANAALLAMLSLGTLAEPGAGAGSVGWSFAAADKTFDYLAAGQTVTLTYQLQAADGQGGVLTQPVTITVTGSNDAPLVAAGTTAAGSVTELAATTGANTSATASGTIRFTDADTADVHVGTIASVSASGVTAGLPANATLLGWLSKGTLTEPAGSTAGALGWTFAAPDSAFDYLAAGHVATLAYVVQVADGKGGTLSQTVTMTVTGSNDAPTIVAGTSASGAVSELAVTTGSATLATASGTIRFADADLANTHSASIVSVTAGGTAGGLPANATLLGWLTKGTLAEPAGGTAGSVPWSFAAPDSAFDYLRAGQTATLAYVVRVSDGIASVDQTVTVTVTGSNDAPLVAAGTSATSAIAELSNTSGATTAATASGAIRFTDAEAADVHSGTIVSVTASGVTGGLPANAALLAMASLGAPTEPAGGTAGSLGWSFTAADKTFDYLAAGQTVTLTYLVRVADGQGGTLDQPVAVTVTGSNDGPASASGSTLTGAITERASATGAATADTAAGTIRFTDPDLADAHAATIASVAASGVTGGLPATATMLAWLSGGAMSEPSGTTPGASAWGFSAPDSAFDYLGAGQTATLTYVVQLSDGKGGTFSQNVVITITGSNDAPTVVVPGAQVARTSTATRIAGLTIGDPDANAASETVTLSTTLGTVAATATGGATVTGSASKSLKISGTIAQVNATLATLTYTSASAGSDTITVATSDGTVTTTKTVAVATSTSANNGPRIAAGTTATGAVTELAATYNSATADTTNGTIRFDDADVPDTHTVTVSSVAATGITGGLPANATLLGFLGKGSVTEPTGTTPGAVTWTFSAPDRTFDYLGTGQVATLAYVVTVADGKGGSTTQTVTITVTGSNDGAVLASGSTTTGAITELAGGNAASTLDTASGVIRFTDEPGDTHAAPTITGVAASGTVTGLPASATMLAWLTAGGLTEPSGSTPGSANWSFAAPDSAFDYLSAGQTATLTYTVRIVDNRGAAFDQPVVVTVTGSNDTPTATAKAGYTTDNWTALTITGATLLTGATDPDRGDTLTLSSVQGAVGGSVALSSGNAVFTPNAALVGPASFTYTIADGKGGTATATASLTVTLKQVNGTTGADTMTGTAGKKAQLDGLAGNDTITAGSAGDVIIGGAGNDLLTGAAGIDTFVYKAGFGLDTINAFTATGSARDLIQVDKSLFADWAHLLGATRQVGSDLVITYDSANTITLKNVALSNFTSANAIFV